MDRLSVSFPVEWIEPDARRWGETAEKGGLLRRSVNVPWEGKVGVFVGVKQVRVVSRASPDGVTRWFGKVEMNPSRLADPEGAGLVGVDEAREVAHAAMGLAAEWVRPACPVEEVRVKRLDVARDFTGVERPAFYIAGLNAVRRRWARKQASYRDPARNHALTMFVGSGAGLARLYDKHAESGGAAPEGTLRWEAECRSGWTERYGAVRRLEDVRVERVEALARDRWEWSAMGVEVAATSRVIEKVRRSGLTPARQRAFLGHLLMAAHGEGWDELSDRTARRWQQLARELGVAIDPEGVSEAPGGFVGRLDYETGREVMRVA